MRLKEDLLADRDYPPIHRVMMDGIAVSFKSYLNNQIAFQIQEIAAAGEPQKKLDNPLHCLEVMTGAPLPAGCDLVIPYEHLSIENGIATITKSMDRNLMEHIHLTGSDCHGGELVLKADSFMHGPHVGIAASMGYKVPKISSQPKILLVSTGDELVEIDTIPANHQIRRSNVYALKRSLELNGYDYLEMTHLKDDAQTIRKHYQEVKDKFDLIIYSGGVSKGKFDYLPSVWLELGVEKLFHEVSQRPGKPLWFGIDHQSKTTVIGLPGNPISSLVCLHRYVIPQKEIWAVLSDEIIFKKDLTYFLPVKLEYSKTGRLIAHPLKVKNSGEFTALAGSDGFIELPREESVFKAGEAFKFFSWTTL
jgi:molybdopterin molybdotransferase